MKSFECPPDMSGAGCEWPTVNESGHMLHNCKASKCVGLHVLWIVPFIFLLKSKVPIIYYTGFFGPGTERARDIFRLIFGVPSIIFRNNNGTFCFRCGNIIIH